MKSEKMKCLRLKKNAILLQKHIDEMNNRLSDIEKNLKEVD